MSESKFVIRFRVIFLNSKHAVLHRPFSPVSVCDRNGARTELFVRAFKRVRFYFDDRENVEMRFVNLYVPNNEYLKSFLIH